MTGWPIPQRPAEALDALAGHLLQCGVTHMYGVSCQLLGVLSVSLEITVWSNGRVLWWRVNDEETVWPAADPGGAVRILYGSQTGSAAQGDAFLKEV